MSSVSNVHGYDKPYFHGFQAFIYGTEELEHYCSRDGEDLEHFISRVLRDLKVLGGRAEICKRLFDVDGSLLELQRVWDSGMPFKKPFI